MFYRQVSAQKMPAFQFAFKRDAAGEETQAAENGDADQASPKEDLQAWFKLMDELWGMDTFVSCEVRSTYLLVYAQVGRGPCAKLQTYRKRLELQTEQGRQGTKDVISEAGALTVLFCFLLWGRVHLSHIHLGSGQGRRGHGRRCRGGAALASDRGSGF